MGCFGVWVRGVVKKCGTVSRVVSGFTASKASAFPDAFFPFFLGEFFNPNGSTSMVYGSTLGLWWLVWFL